ncbi:unnamed protein product [Cochlearia groenlandica]
MDSDDTSLGCLSEMLRECGYRIVATARADDVQFIINNKDEQRHMCLMKTTLSLRRALASGWATMRCH